MSTGFEGSQQHFLAYGFDRVIRQESIATFKLRFASLMLRESGNSKEKTCARHEFSWDVPIAPSHHHEPGVSGTVGLAMRRDSLTSAPQMESTILERNIADLITMHVGQAAKVRNSLVIVLGPPLSKVIGRLAYRCINSSTTVAFFSWPDVFETEYGPVVSAGLEWHGPYPSFHEDANVRTFYYPGGAHPKIVPVRVDLFGQSFGGSARCRASADATDERLASIKSLVASAPFKCSDGSVAQIPYDLGRLQMSLRWDDERFLTMFERHKKSFVSKNETAKVAHLQKGGILGMRSWNIGDQGSRPLLNPHERLGAETSYARERLFAYLQQEIDQFGERDGFVRFVRGGNPDKSK